MSGKSERVDGDDEKRGEGVERGGGGPRVLLVMNLVLSIVLVAMVVYGPLCIDLATFSVVNVASAALVLTTITYLAVN